MSLKRDIAVLFILLTGWVQGQIIVGPDTAMNTANWSIGDSAKSSGVNIDSSGTLSNVTDSQLGAALRVSLQFDMSGGSQWVAQSVFHNTWVYNPSADGALSSLSFSGDFTANYGVSVRVALKQDGKIYWQSSSSQVVSNTFMTTIVYTNLASNDFVEIGGTSVPDFSESGGEITLGYILRYGSTAVINNRALQLNANNSQFTLIKKATLRLLILSSRKASGKTEHGGRNQKETETMISISRQTVLAAGLTHC